MYFSRWCHLQLLKYSSLYQSHLKDVGSSSFSCSSRVEGSLSFGFVWFVSGLITNSLVQIAHFGDLITRYFSCWYLTIQVNWDNAEVELDFFVTLEKKKHFALDAESFEINDEITQ